MPTLVAYIGMPQGMEWVVILVIMLVIFGRKLPEFGRYLGKQVGRLRNWFKAPEDDAR
jgi:sec-independent protein translocase protein TatA